MTSTARIGVVFNPNSKKNRKRPERFDALVRLVGDLGEVRRTEKVEEIEALADELLDRRVDYWVADGGDGAFHWLVNAAASVVRARGRSEAIPPIMPTRSGTVDFLAAKAALSGGAEDLIANLVACARRGVAVPTIALDALRLRGTTNSGEIFDRIGFASAVAGVGQGFFERFYDNGDPTPRGILTVVSRILGSASLSTPGVAALPMPAGAREYAAPVFAPQTLDVWLDGEKVDLPCFRAVNIGSINLDLAGVFRIFPFAAERGVLHALVGDPGVYDIVTNLPRLASGRTLASPRLIERAVRNMRVVARDGATIDPVIDGELFFGLREVDIELAPPVQILAPVAPEMPTRARRRAASAD